LVEVQIELERVKQETKDQIEDLTEEIANYKSKEENYLTDVGLLRNLDLPKCVMLKQVDYQQITSESKLLRDYNKSQW